MLHDLRPADFPLDDPKPAPAGLSANDRTYLKQCARAEDLGHRSISDSIQRLRELGWLTATLPTLAGRWLGQGGKHAQSSVNAFIELAEINLSLARLFEGHVNALALLRLHADESLFARVPSLVVGGALLGVWGANDHEPVVFAANGRNLSGRKRYASGLGVVTDAVVSVGTGNAVQLCLVDVRNQAFADPSAWSMLGMHASASGTYDFSRVAASSIARFGNPGDFLLEPGLVGGVWRIAALQLGAIYGLLEAAREHLRRCARLDDPAQIARLAPLVYRAEAARHLIESAGRLCDDEKTPAPPERVVCQSIFARLLTERLGLDTIAATERSMGLPHFERSSESGRIARDLATYMRQISPDAFLQRSGREALNTSGPLRELFSS